MYAYIYSTEEVHPIGDIDEDDYEIPEGSDEWLKESEFRFIDEEEIESLLKKEKLLRDILKPIKKWKKKKTLPLLI